LVTVNLTCSTYKDGREILLCFERNPGYQAKLKAAGQSRLLPTVTAMANIGKYGLFFYSQRKVLFEAILKFTLPPSIVSLSHTSYPSRRHTYLIGVVVEIGELHDRRRETSRQFARQSDWQALAFILAMEDVIYAFTDFFFLLFLSPRFVHRNSRFIQELRHISSHANTSLLSFFPSFFLAHSASRTISFLLAY
jgi:hypothetical protein